MEKFVYFVLFLALYHFTSSRTVPREASVKPDNSNEKLCSDLPCFMKLFLRIEQQPKFHGHSKWAPSENGTDKTTKTKSKTAGNETNPYSQSGRSDQTHGKLNQERKRTNKNNEKDRGLHNDNILTQNKPNRSAFLGTILNTGNKRSVADTYKTGSSKPVKISQGTDDFINARNDHKGPEDSPSSKTDLIDNIKDYYIHKVMALVKSTKSWPRSWGWGTAGPEPANDNIQSQLEQLNIGQLSHLLHNFQNKYSTSFQDLYLHNVCCDIG